MLDMMVSAWSQPALQAHRIEGYTLAGKSGTADIPGPGGYKSGTYASYVGLGPVPNPRFVILVRIDRPDSLYGGVAAAPAFRSVANELLIHMQIPPQAPGDRTRSVTARAPQ
jgi:cell division protein FtsI/penicillin-binding protein 2